MAIARRFCTQSAAAGLSDARCSNFQLHQPAIGSWKLAASQRQVGEVAGLTYLK
ncbi:MULTISPECIES: hypothetical protein [unclassified Tolypothrix]|uniref:hypothetical protein n=1 Tax=unclassified Tolypothrix TaxID=2649714 RepID=UPI0005EAA326|nr:MULTISPECIES: hypothetical protein [unclassified Tolypothrix]EKF04361.1 hypothetical protein FDUTEX481_02040 [Tolypothrix sp. PCC 7601]MBE9081008.1 hypothetical protein [Tolypothrix sp. LEGE 11397]UYD24925.1 hypothetical protein HGR01_26440 [Tolypothrix sp. PCC 7712]UYD32842.1 hypothetical protein HG267_28195 [Tolypothrix sp. PCC 7601]